MIRAPQVFPGLQAGIAGFTFPPQKFRYRIITLNVAWQYDATVADRVFKLTQTFNVDQLVVFAIATAAHTASTTGTLTFSHVPVFADVLEDPSGIWITNVPIPFDMYVEPGHSINLTVTNFQAGDLIGTMTLVVDDDVAQPAKKHLPSSG